MQYDILVIGAGPSGLSLACSLRGSGLRIALIEKQPEQTLSDPAYDGREIALTHLSVDILTRLDVWTGKMAEHATLIKGARVVDGDSPYTLNFDRPDPQLEALGYMVSNHHIRKSLYDQSRTLDDVDLICEQSVTAVHTDADQGTVTLSDGRELTARLVVAADSRFSESRRMMGIPASMKDFGRVAVVCRMQHDLPHDSIAWECFHYGRTLAILPLSENESSVVITLPADRAGEVTKVDEESFNADIQQRFNDRLGNMRLVSERFAYPLVGVHANRFIATRFALLGDAAVGMHPVTAHGFNLGLRGQDTLTGEIRKAITKGGDIGSDTVLRPYQHRHSQVTRPLYHGTNGIVGLFTDDREPVKALRKAALHLSNHLPPIKYIITSALTEKRNRNLLPF